MILIGALLRLTDCAGHSWEESCYCDDNWDIHSAARDMWKIANYGSNFHSRTLIKAEFHDTGTQKTWSVDSCGHTKYDYHKEKTEDFQTRWGGKHDA